MFSVTETKMQFRWDFIGKPSSQMSPMNSGTRLPDTTVRALPGPSMKPISLAFVPAVLGGSCLFAWYHTLCACAHTCTHAHAREHFLFCWLGQPCPPWTAQESTALGKQAPYQDFRDKGRPWCSFGPNVRNTKELLASRTLAHPSTLT